MRFVFTAFFIIATLICGYAFAEEKKETPKQLEEIVVTATRTEKIAGIGNFKSASISFIPKGFLIFGQPCFMNVTPRTTLARRSIMF